MDIVTRAKNIILSPNTEWPVIAAEQTTVKDLYQGYIAPLMAIGPICSFLALLFFARGLGVGAGLVGMIVIYAINLAATYVVALLAQFLAPQFGGRADIVDALKLVAYSSTPAWVGGIFNLIPLLAILDLLLALYGFYLLYAGATPVVNVPKERAAIFTIVLVVAVIIVFFITSTIVGAIVGAGMMGMGGTR
jgi:hypothetical protein